MLNSRLSKNCKKSTFSWRTVCTRLSMPTASIRARKNNKYCLVLLDHYWSYWPRYHHCFNPPRSPLISCIQCFYIFLLHTYQAFLDKSTLPTKSRLQPFLIRIMTLDGGGAYPTLRSKVRYEISRLSSFNTRRFVRINAFSIRYKGKSPIKIVSAFMIPLLTSLFSAFFLLLLPLSLKKVVSRKNYAKVVRSSFAPEHS
jgi:hypothetical protein